MLMASKDLSAVFNVVNIDFFIKRRLSLIGLSEDVVSLTEVWLIGRYFYVLVNGLTSYFHEINSGTIQSSILVQFYMQYMFSHCLI